MNKQRVPNLTTFDSLSGIHIPTNDNKSQKLPCVAKPIVWTVLLQRKKVCEGNVEVGVGRRQAMTEVSLFPPRSSDYYAAGPSSPPEPPNSVRDPKEYLFKVLVIGDIGTGKTSVIKRYVHNYFSQHYRATIGVDFAMKVINWKGNAICRLQLWDIAG